MTETALAQANPNVLATIAKLYAVGRGADAQTLDSVKFDIHDRWNTHPGTNLTARRLIDIILEAERGRPQRLCELFGDVLRRDSHLRSEFLKRISSVAGKQWMVQAGGDSDADVLAATLLERAIRRVPNIRATLRHWLKAPFFGWSVSEPLWGPDEDGRIVPQWFENIMHRRMVFDGWGCPRLPIADKPTDTGSGFDPPQVTRAPLDDSLETFGDGWVYATQEEHDVATSGLLITAMWMSLFKGMDIRDMVVFNERYGLPFPYGKYGTDTPKKERDELAKAVAMLGRDGYATFHRDCDIDTVKVDISGTPSTVHLPAIAFYNAEISKLFCGATLTSGEGTSAGSYALGQVHENVLFQFTLDDADWVGDVFQQQIGVPFVAYNHMDAMPPRLKIHVVKEMDPTQRLGIFVAVAKSLGVPLDADQVRQELQLKKPRGETIGGGEEAQSPATPAAEKPGQTPPPALASKAEEIARRVMGNAAQ